MAARKGEAKALAKIYSEHLKTTQAREDMDRLAALVKTSGPACLLCYERDHANCHRTFIAEVIKSRDGVTIENLVAPQI